jgi:hypothetical protein
MSKLSAKYPKLRLMSDTFVETGDKIKIQDDQYMGRKKKGDQIGFLT